MVFMQEQVGGICLKPEDIFDEIWYIGFRFSLYLLALPSRARTVNSRCCSLTDVVQVTLRCS